MRLAYAAKRLLQQVGCNDHPSCGAVGDPDAFGVHRTVMVPVEHALALGSDPRVREVVVVSSGLGEVALVAFRTGRRGDLTQSFSL